MGAGDGRNLIRIAKNSPGARRATQWSTGAIVRDELQRLRRIVRGRTWLSHEPLQSLNRSPYLQETIECPLPHGRRRPLRERTLQTRGALGAVACLAVFLTACGPRTHFPLLPSALPSALALGDSSGRLARDLAPILYLQRDESFPLERIVAVIHPSRRVIAYYLTYRHDIAARWSPFSQGADEEEFWVGYDATFAPTDLWTYWHGDILHVNWRGKGELGVNVQWGKHGSIPARDADARHAPGQVARALLRDVLRLSRSRLRTLFERRAPLLLPQFFALSRVHEARRPRLETYRDRAHGGSRFAAIGRFRRALRTQAVLAVGAPPLRAHVEIREWRARAARHAMTATSTVRIRRAY